MSEPGEDEEVPGDAVLGVVLAHGDVAHALVGAVEEISGESGALVALSNRGLAGPDLDRELAALAGDRSVVVFVDLWGGSCGIAGLRHVKSPGPSSGRRACISGVSLPVLLDFVFNRHLPLPELVDRLLDRGRSGLRGICDTSSGASPA